MTPVPLELPLRPAEAAELANLIFDQAEGKKLSDELRNRLASRVPMMKLQTTVPFIGSLERDPIHHSVYYLAVDAAADGAVEAVPLLLHLALATAPTSSIYYKPLLIGRMRRPNGSEMVINTIPFGPADKAAVETFAARINPAFYPQPQGARTTITVERDYSAAFEFFRGLQKRTSKNFAALIGECHAAMWAAIRAGWRSAYTAVADVTAAGSLDGFESFSRYAVPLALSDSGLENAERMYQQIRNARAAAKVSRGFDLELASQAPMSPKGLRAILERLKDGGRLPQLVYAGAIAEADLDDMAATAQQFQVTLSFRYGGESGDMVRRIGRAMAGRLDYRVRSVGEAEFVAENLL